MAKWILSIVIVVCAIQLSEAQGHFETYTYTAYRSSTNCRTMTRRPCSGWWWDESCHTEYYCEYYAVTESVAQTGIKCQQGWSPSTSCNVVDPCIASTSGCQQLCTYGGTNASYVCSCYPGYELTTDGHSCQLSDACTTRGNDCRKMENFICRSTSGGYQCVCKDGFTLVNPQRCADDDECAAHTDNCNATENSVCQNTIGGYQCNCKKGFALFDTHQCSDIDECNILMDNCTLYENLTCENTIGSFKCNCPVGFTHLDDLRCYQPTAENSGFKSLSTGGQSGIIAAIVVCGVLILTALIGVPVFIFYRRKRNRNNGDSGSSRPDIGVAGTAVENIYDAPERESKTTIKATFAKIFTRQLTSANQYSLSETATSSNETLETDSEKSTKISNKIQEPPTDEKGGEGCFYEDLVSARRGHDEAAQNTYQCLVNAVGKDTNRPTGISKK